MATFHRQYGFDGNSVVLNHLPLHHSDGLNQGPLLALAQGATILRPPAVTMQSLGLLLDMAYREQATHLVTVPTVLAMMLRLPRDYDEALRYDGFRFIASTAGPLSEAVWRQVEERFGVQVVNSYGLTETCIEALYCGPDAATRRLGTIGKPVDCQARIVTDEGREAAEGERGELWLSGENVMLGYLDQPAATAEVLQDGWLRTGDLAARDAEGFYRIVGRRKSVIIRAGINVYPEDVNGALLACPLVAQASTVGMPDDLLGERVVACVTLRNGGGSAPAQEIMEHCRRTLAPERLPNRIEILDELPFGPSGKVEQEKLRQRLAAQEDVSASAGASVAERVLAVAAKAFRARPEELSSEQGDEEIAGWDSLNYLEFVMGLERAFSFRMAPRDVMSIRRLADAVAVVEREAGRR
jgi:long-chain acyl-CoA synthetase